MTAAHAAPVAFDLEAFLREARDDAERALADLPLGGIPARLHEPIGYALRAGGKRLRPILCVAAWRALRGSEVPPAVHRAAGAIELIHAYSLVHDDLPFMDDDDVRRGRPTTHRAHGAATATVTGAAMITLAFHVLTNAMTELDASPEQQRAALAELGAAAGAAGMVGGQWLDLAAEGRALPRPELDRVHALKTGALIRASVVLGGILAGATPMQRDALATYGASIGLAFQIADDILDARGDSIAIGKTAGRDAALAKSTYPGLLGVEAAERLARDHVASARRALAAEGIRATELDALAAYAVERSA